jgi:hypothetical protein
MLSALTSVRSETDRCGSILHSVGPLQRFKKGEEPIARLEAGGVARCQPRATRPARRPSWHIAPGQVPETSEAAADRAGTHRERVGLGIQIAEEARADAGELGLHQCDGLAVQG